MKKHSTHSQHSSDSGIRVCCGAGTVYLKSDLIKWQMTAAYHQQMSVYAQYVYVCVWLANGALNMT